MILSNVTVFDGTSSPPAAGTDVHITDGRFTVVRGGRVVSMDAAVGDLQVGDVLIEDGRVAAVARSLDVADAEIVDATGKIVMPGFVDTHRHTWQTAFRAPGSWLPATGSPTPPASPPSLDAWLSNLGRSVPRRRRGER